MRAINHLTLFFLIFHNAIGQKVTDRGNLIVLCDVCTCSEILDVDATHLVLNVLCSELDKIKDVPDLEKIVWPANPNGLKISATFEGLGLSTLAKLPPNTQVETLRFNTNAITTYWPDPFSDVPNLRTLSFTQNELTEVTPDLFTKIDTLEELDLSYNKIALLNPLDFKNLRNVKKLNLQSNRLKNIPVKALEPMTVLEDLDLSKNNIYDVLLQKTEGNTLKGVKRLSLSGNRIRSIMNDSFPLNNNIELLDLSNNTIEVIDELAFLSCTNLKELNLEQNNITFTFAMPSTLQIAILKINTLFHWPDFPSGITYIDLSYNRLSEMYDESNFKFENLEVLNIGGNQIKEVNIERKLSKLLNLDLSYNLIQEVPKSLNSQNLPSLEELRLDGNPIASVYFKNIIAVKRLYMNELSKLSIVEDKAFSNVIGRGVDEALEEKICFSLYLSGCSSLYDIQDGAFDGTSLCMLDISKNNLTKLSKNLLKWSTLSEGVNLQYNPWDCSCPLQWILDELLPQMYKNHSYLLNELRCATPRALDRVRLVHWYNWTEQAMCSDLYLRSGPHGTYMLEPSTERASLSKVTTLTLILGGCIIIGLLIAIALSVYLVKSRRKHRVKQAALKRQATKRQSTKDTKHTNGIDKEQYTALNKV